MAPLTAGAPHRHNIMQHDIKAAGQYAANRTRYTALLKTWMGEIYRSIERADNFIHGSRLRLHYIHVTAWTTALSYG